MLMQWRHAPLKRTDITVITCNAHFTLSCLLSRTLFLTFILPGYKHWVLTWEHGLQNGADEYNEAETVLSSAFAKRPSATPHREGQTDVGNRDWVVPVDKTLGNDVQY